jgi:capsular polysaccharide transport system ATP-binding protein
VIQLYNVSKYHFDSYLGHEVVLRGATFSIPTDRRVAIVGEDASVLSTILLMLSGSKTPDRGEITRGRVRFSPVINANGAAGQVWVRQMTGLENLRSLASMYGVDPNHLVALVEAAGSFGSYLSLPMKKFDSARRRALEVAAITALPFDCYIVDALQSVAPFYMRRLFRAAEARGSGVIFCTQREQQATRWAEATVVASEGQLRWAGTGKES